MSSDAVMTALDKPMISDEAALWLFLRHLRSSALMDTDDVEMLSREITPDQLDGLYSLLIEDGYLTPYQLKRIREGRPDGLVIGQYRILDEVGRGGFGRVYLARHAMMGREVALKVIDPQWAKERTGRDLFLREVAVAGRLIHPNIASAYDANDIDGSLFFAMEFVAGQTLERYVLEKGPLPITLARAVIRQTALALQSAHEHGVVHRDIKPANLLLPGLVDQEHPDSFAIPPVLVKVVDFGIARLRTRGSEPTSTILCEEGAIVGTPAFMAPEQISDVHAVDIRSDLYSLGCTAYFALTGRTPFRGTTTQHTCSMIRESDPDPMRSHRAEIPAELAAIVQRLMARNPEKRFQTPAELVEALDASLLSMCTTTPAPAARLVLAPAAPRAVPTTTPPPTMSLKSVAELAGWLRDWCQIVECLVQGTDPGIDEREYKALYRILVGSIRGGSENLFGPPDDLCEQLLALIEPWVTLNALDQLDRRSLLGLWQTCQRLNDRLAPKRKKSRVTRYAALAVALAVLIAGGMWKLGM